MGAVREGDGGDDIEWLGEALRAVGAMGAVGAVGAGRAVRAVRAVRAEGVWAHIGSLQKPLKGLKPEPRAARSGQYGRDPNQGRPGEDNGRGVTAVSGGDSGGDGGDVGGVGGGVGGG